MQVLDERRKGVADARDDLIDGAAQVQCQSQAFRGGKVIAGLHDEIARIVNVIGVFSQAAGHAVAVGPAIERVASPAA